MIREQIAVLLQDYEYENRHGEGVSPYMFSLKFLALPSGLEAIGKCKSCNGAGNILIQHNNISHPNTCFKCNGTGEIVRDLTMGEAIELPKLMAQGKVNVRNEPYIEKDEYGERGYPQWFIYLPSGERVRVKK